MTSANRNNPLTRLAATLAGVLACASALGQSGLSEGVVGFQEPEPVTAEQIAADARTIDDPSRLPEEVQGLEVTERSGEKLPGELVLTTSTGEAVSLGSYFNEDGRPIILSLVYYQCPVACTAVLDKMCVALSQLNYEPGEDYQIVVVSFNHREDSSHAALKKELALAKLEKGFGPEVRDGVAFHTTDAATASMLSEATGFPYRLLQNGEYAHPIATMIVTPAGRVSRYIHGFDYPPRRVRLALLEASEGEIGNSIGDIFLASCFLYDPTTGAYSLQAFRVMQFGAIASAVLLAVLIVTLRVKEILKKRREGLARGAATAGGTA